MTRKMRWMLALLLAAVMTLCSCSALAIPEGYPAVIEGLDFGGKTVHIYDWWNRDDENHSNRYADPDENTQKKYDYRDWLEATYNVKIVETAWEKGGWLENIQALTDVVAQGDDSELRVVALANDFAGSALEHGLFMPWAEDATGADWSQPAKDFMTHDGVTYGVHPGHSEPRNMLFFNKRVLEEAGIDWQDIYEAQRNGSWTWEYLDSILSQVQRDVDNDGVNDIWGMTGNSDTLTIGLVFSNNGSFFDYNEKGELVVTADKKETVDALQMRKDLEQYMAQKPDGSSWDWYREYWAQGNTAFYAGEAYDGFNGNGAVNGLDDEWGAVMFPMGPAAETYVAPANENIYGVPAVYDEETAKKLEQIFKLYYASTPGVDPDIEIYADKYMLTDQWAVDETYSMMLDPSHIKDNKTYLLGSSNDVLGSSLLWGPLNELTPAEAIEAARPDWEDRIAVFNGTLSQEGYEARKAAREAEKEQAKVTKLSAFVERNYAKILGRDADPAGEEYWVDQLKNGAVSGGGLMYGFVNSAEFKNKPVSNREKIEIMYNVMLDRPADEGGIEYWLDRMNNGMSINAIAAGFVGSPEFKGVCVDFGIENGDYELTEARDVNYGVTSFVTRCYGEALSRTSDDGGLNYWCEKMLSGEQTPQEVAAGFVFSPEMDAENKIESNPDALLDSLYKLYLGREADEAGKAYWKDRIAGGLTLEALNEGFAASAEFTGIVAGYGLQ